MRGFSFGENQVAEKFFGTVTSGVDFFDVGVCCNFSRLRTEKNFFVTAMSKKIFLGARTIFIHIFFSPPHQKILIWLLENFFRGNARLSRPDAVYCSKKATPPPLIFFSACIIMPANCKAFGGRSQFTDGAVGESLRSFGGICLTVGELVGRFKSWASTDGWGIVRQA